MALLAVRPVARAQTRFATPTREPAYASYNVEQCWAAVERAHNYAVWGIRRDTLSPAGRLTAPEDPSVIEIARQCTGHLALAQLPATAQPMLLSLWGAAQEDTLYLRALRARLATIRSPAEQGGSLRDEVLRWLHDRPPWAGLPVALLDTLIGELDRLGAPAAEAAVAAHEGRAVLARDLDDLPSAVRELRSAWAAESAFRRFDSTWVQRSWNVRSLRASDDVVMRHFVPLDTLLRQNAPEAWLDLWRRDAGVAARTWRLSTQDSANIVATVLRGGGRTAPPLQANFWFNRSDSTARPLKGKVSLVTFVDERCGARCYVDYGALKRLKHRFGEGLDVVLVTSTKGYFRQHPPLEPAGEAEVLRQYFLDRLALPATLAVITTPFTTLPAPDRRRFYNGDQTPVFSAYDVKTAEAVSGSVLAFVIAPDGFLLGWRSLQTDEVELAYLIADLLAYPREHP